MAYDAKWKKPIKNFRVQSNMLLLFNFRFESGLIESLILHLSLFIRTRNKNNGYQEKLFE